MVSCNDRDNLVTRVFRTSSWTQEHRKEMTFNFAGEALRVHVFEYAKESLERKRV